MQNLLVCLLVFLYNSFMIKIKQNDSVVCGLQKRIETLYDHLYANASFRTPSGISNEVGKILHTGLFRESVLKTSPAFVFDESLWRVFNAGFSKEGLAYSSVIKRDFIQMNKVWQLYEKEAKIELNDFDLCFTCYQLSSLTLSDPVKDIPGDTLEIIRSQWVKRMGGQFFTDQHVTSLAMKLLDFNPLAGEDLIDICAGTGGFLLAGLNHIRFMIEDKFSEEEVETETIKVACKALHGQEVDSEVAEIANSTLQARLGKNAKGLVISGDSLAYKAFTKSSGKKISFDSHLCAASNPPFGTKITIKDPQILEQFELASRPNSSQKLLFPGQLKPTAPDILFLERNIRMLVPGRGRLAIVLPYQILSGPKTQFVREWLLRNVNILAVIDLPDETFQPHTGTKTSLLVVQRRQKPLLELTTDLPDYKIFMSIPRWIGHDRRGHPVYAKTPDGKTKDVVLTDLPDVGLAFQAFKRNDDFRAIHEFSFSIDSSTIFKDPLLRLNALFHRPALETKENWSDSLIEKGWSFVKLKDVTKRVFYPGRFKRNYVDYFPGAVPFLGGSNITEFLATKDKWLSPNDPKLADLRVQAGWLLVTRSGTTGIVSSVPDSWDGFAMSEHIIRIIPDPEKLDQHYLLAFLRSRHCQEQIARGVFGSVIDEITPQAIADLEIPIPKSKKALDKVAAQIQEGEKSRNLGIVHFMSGSECFEQMLKA